MPTTPKSPGELIQESLVALLTAGAADLKVDTRTPRIIDELQGQRFSQKGMPLVLVDSPIVQSDEDFGGDEVAETWMVPMVLVDAIGVRKVTRTTGERRLSLLAQKVKHFLLGHADPCWGLAQLRVFGSQSDWEIGAPSEGLGNNLLGLPIKLTVVAIVPVGTIFQS